MTKGHIHALNINGRHEFVWTNDICCSNEPSDEEVINYLLRNAIQDTSKEVDK